MRPPGHAAGSPPNRNAAQWADPRAAPGLTPYAVAISPKAMPGMAEIARGLPGRSISSAGCHRFSHLGDRRSGFRQPTSSPVNLSGTGSFPPFRLGAWVNVTSPEQSKNSFDALGAATPNRFPNTAASTRGMRDASHESRRRVPASSITNGPRGRCHPTRKQLGIECLNA